MDLKEIERIIKLVEESGIDELEIEEGGTRIRVKKGGYPAPLAYDHILPSLPQHPQAPAVPSLPDSEAAEPARVIESPLSTITSPMVGTFYRAGSPEEAPYVQIGTEVNVDSVVCILEAMKVMNEIKSGCNGKIVEILVENAQAVEFGQPLFRVAEY